ncbi:hypothetical protein GCM10009579_04380 [Streptomyces javensis]|uniref:Uncharacterized protein n=1 Tax=Streptomyces javensis TaxID=114698 RepID=A0ABN1WHG7_9ACTN
MLESGIQRSERAYPLIAVCMAFSIAAHSSTDVPVARLFDVEDLVGIPDGGADGRHDEGREKQTAGSARTASRVEEDDDACT